MHALHAHGRRAHLVSGQSMPPDAPMRLRAFFYPPPPPPLPNSLPPPAHSLRLVFYVGFGPFSSPSPSSRCEHLIPSINRARIPRSSAQSSAYRTHSLPPCQSLPIPFALEAWTGKQSSHAPLWVRSGLAEAPRSTAITQGPSRQPTTGATSPCSTNTRQPHAQHCFPACLLDRLRACLLVGPCQSTVRASSACRPVATGSIARRRHRQADGTRSSRAWRGKALPPWHARACSFGRAWRLDAHPLHAAVLLAPLFATLHRPVPSRPLRPTATLFAEAADTRSFVHSPLLLFIRLLCPYKNT